MLHVGSIPPEITDANSYGQGILALDASFKIQNNSQFTGLSQGVVSLYLFDLDAPMTITNTNFTNNYIGIWSSAGNANSITHCNFELGQVPNSDIMPDQLGIHLSYSMTGFTIENNRFSQGHPNEELLTVGINCFNVGTSNKSIGFNDLNGLNIGNRASGICGEITNSGTQGLYYECNINQENSQYDFLVCDHAETSSDRIRSRQISNGNLSVQNVFSNSGSPNDRDFANGEGELIDYYAPLGGNNSNIPNEYSGFSSLQFIDKNDCITESCPPPCKEETELQQMRAQFYTDRQNYRMAVAGQEATGVPIAVEPVGTEPTVEAEEIGNLRSQMDRSSYLVLEQYLSDTLSTNMDSIRQWMEFTDNYDGAVRLAFDRLRTAPVSGFAELSQISDNNALSEAQQSDLSRLQEVYTLLAEKTIDELNEMDIEQLAIIHGEQHQFSSGIAHNMLMAKGRGPSPSLCEIGRVRSRADQSLTSTNSEAQKSEIRVYPNPAKSYVSFDTRSDSPVRLSILHPSGQLLKTRTIINRWIWDTTPVAPGVYFYRMERDDAEAVIGKIIIQ